MDTAASTTAKTPEDLKAILELVQAKYRDGADKMSLEEKKKHCDMLQNVLKMVGSMEKDLKQSVDTSDHEGMVLQMRGGFPRDGKGLILIPSKEEVQRAFVTSGGGRNPQVVSLADVESVFHERNFHHIQYGPTSPNYLLEEIDVFVKFASVDQATVVLGVGGNKAFQIQNMGFGVQFVIPSKDTTTRTAFRTAGDLILRLNKVDKQLKTLGAVPGRGGVPELSEMLVQLEDFDAAVTSRGYDKATIHAYLCTRIRVDRRKRQAALEPLVNERIEILMELAKIDQDKYPFVCEREFK